MKKLRMMLWSYRRCMKKPTTRMNLIADMMRSSPPGGCWGYGDVERRDPRMAVMKPSTIATKT